MNRVVYLLPLQYSNKLIFHAHRARALYANFDNFHFKTSTESGLMSGVGDERPYANSLGMTSSHLSPSRIICIASVQPLMTWFGANFVGWPRLYEESNSSPAIVFPL